MFVARLMLSGRGASPRKLRGQVLEHRAEFFVSALGAALDHVGDDFFPALARQAHGRRPLRLVAGAAHLEEGILAGPIRQLSRGGRAQPKHEANTRAMAHVRMACDPCLSVHVFTRTRHPLHELNCD